MRSYRRMLKLINWSSVGILSVILLCAVLAIGTHLPGSSAATPSAASDELPDGLHLVHLGHAQSALASTVALPGSGTLSAPNEDIDGADLWSDDSVGLLIDVPASSATGVRASDALQVTAVASNGDAVDLPYKILGPEQGFSNTLCCRLQSSYPASVTYVDVTVRNAAGRHRTWRIQRLNRPQSLEIAPRMATPHAPSKETAPSRPNQCTPQRLVPAAVMA